MKKTLLFIALFAFAVSTFAQDDPIVGQSNQVMSKNGHKLLPDSGQWGLVIDASPFFEFIGNAFNGNSNNSSPSWNFLNENFMITGKCVKGNGKVRRYGIRIGMTNQTNEYETELDSSNGDPFLVKQYGNDEQKISTMSIILSAGFENHRGVSRIDGYYGAEALLGFGGGEKTTNTFANAMTVDPDSITGGGDGNATPTTVIPGAVGSFGYITESNRKGGFMFGVRAFIGANYFVAPQIAIGGEFGWSIGIHSLGATEETSQRYQATDPNGNVTNSIVTETHENPGSESHFDIDTDNGWSSGWFNQLAGSLTLSVYF